MNNLPERLEQLDLSKNSREREALRARLVSKAWRQLPEQAKRRKQNEHLVFFIRLAAATALVALMVGLNWQRTFFAATPPAATPAVDINQIVSATFQAMTQESQSANTVTPAEVPTQASGTGSIATPVPEAATQENPQLFLVPPAETPAAAPEINKASFLTSTDTVPTRALNAENTPILPKRLYFIRYMASNTGGQIYRLEKDGKSITQITSEAGDGVIGFDFSPTQNRIVYIAGNQLTLVDPNGSNRQTLVTLEGSFASSPHWSPDGQIIAFQNNGKIYFYSMQTESPALVLEDSSGSKVYSPGEFSPNGQKLLVKSSGIPSSGQVDFIYDILSKILTAVQPLKPGEASSLGDVMTSWVDSNSIFGFYPTSGPAGAGLWQVNANDGAIEPIIWSTTAPPMTGVLAPRRTDNGDLLYLYTLSETLDSPLTLVRSASDGITKRTAIRPETFFGFDALWSPKGDALLLLQTSYPGHSATSLVFIPIDSSLPVITLLPDASTVGEIFRWGP